MLVLQSCTDPLQVLPGSSCETFPTPSDGTYDVGNSKCDTVVEEEEEVNVKTEKVIGSGEEKCTDTKGEEDVHCEEEEEIYMDIDIKKEVRMRIQCNIL
jgi:hypothetical protein